MSTGSIEQPINGTGNVTRPIKVLALEERREVQVRLVYAGGRREVRSGVVIWEAQDAVFVQLAHRPGAPSYGEGGWYALRDVRPEPAELGTQQPPEGRQEAGSEG